MDINTFPQKAAFLQRHFFIFLSKQKCNEKMQNAMHFGYQSWVSISMSFWLNGETHACAVYAEIIFRDFRESVELRDNDNMNSDERPQDFICQRTSVKSSQKRKHFKPTRRDVSRGLLWHVFHQGTGEINTTVKIWIIAA